MNYYSLNHQSSNVNFREATVLGQAPDGGLYFPTSIPKLPETFIQNLALLSKEEIGFAVMQPFVGNEIEANDLKLIVSQTVNFEFPLVNISSNISALELFHGPTLAFKDVGARFMSRCLGYFNQHNSKKVTVLVATSGDTGGAVADGFFGVDGVEVVILFPKNKVSKVQELQLTTHGKNITALEVDGSFDDCQAMVKQAFKDQDITLHKQLTSANSINVARWLPQQMYYYFAYQQWIKNNSQPPVVCVPSGNFGNIAAAVLAYTMGLPTKHFIAACNANDTVPKWFNSNEVDLQNQQSVATISNAMDVAKPSNFIRVLEMFGKDALSLKNKMSCVSVNDNDTKNVIEEIYKTYNYMLDPHTAVGYFALENYLKQNVSEKGLVAATAHPVKFPNVIEKVLKQEIPIPESVQHLLQKEKKSVPLSANYIDFKNWLLSN
jgi:threonine synthase